MVGRVVGDVVSVLVTELVAVAVAVAVGVSVLVIVLVVVPAGLFNVVAWCVAVYDAGEDVTILFSIWVAGM